MVLGSVFALEDSDVPAGPEVHLRGRGAAGATGRVEVHVPRRVSDADGHVHGAEALDLDRPGVIVVHLDRALDAPLRLHLRGRGLLAPEGRRGDILLDVRPDAALIQSQDATPMRGVSGVARAGLAAAALLVVALILRVCVG